MTAKRVDPGARRLLDATAGSLGALFVCVLMYPVDIAKTKIQSGCSRENTVARTCRAIVEMEGLGALFTGVGAKSLHALIQNFIYFYTYEWLKDSARLLGFRQSTASNITLGVAAGLTNLTVTLPLETLIVRIQTSEPGRASTYALMKELTHQGRAGMYKGFYLSSILTLNPALNFAIFGIQPTSPFASHSSPS
jgi:solute carrier family 25 (peroxisomal adenine nucleotide transporter), member 17